MNETLISHTHLELEEVCAPSQGGLLLNSLQPRMAYVQQNDDENRGIDPTAGFNETQTIIRSYHQLCIC
jgi:hypothetical protein